MFEVAEAAFLVLANQFADILAWRTPVARSNLPFYIFLEGFGELLAKSERHAVVLKINVVCHLKGI